MMCEVCGRKQECAIGKRAVPSPGISQVDLVSIRRKSGSVAMVSSSQVDLASPRPRSQSDLIALSIRSSQDGHISGQS
jgi:hypothetical protein